MLHAPPKSAAARAQEASQRCGPSCGQFWRVTAEQRGDALAMWDDGIDTADIAFELGVHQSVIHNAIGRR